MGQKEFQQCVEGGETEVEPVQFTVRNSAMSCRTGLRKPASHGQQVWADHKIECKVCKKFFKDEAAWQVHFVERHSDKELSAGHKNSSGQMQAEEP